MDCDQIIVRQKRTRNYTQISNDFIRGCHDGLAAIIFIHLASLPPGFKASKNYISTFYHISRKLADKKLKYLQDNKVILLTQLRNEDGTFGALLIDVLDEENFQEIVPYTGRKKKANSQPLDVKRPAVKRPTVGDTPYNINNTVLDINTKNNINNIRANPENEDVDNFKEKLESFRKQKKDDGSDPKQKSKKTKNIYSPAFEAVYAAYPVHRAKLTSFQIWNREGLEAKGPDILADIRNRLLNDSAWQNPQYIIQLPRYLRGKRWEDEITLKKPDQSRKPTVTEIFDFVDSLADNKNHGGRVYEHRE